MSNVIPIIPTLPLTTQARNLNMSIIKLCDAKGLTPDQLRARLEAVELLAREAHDCIVDAEFEQRKN